MILKIIEGDYNCTVWMRDFPSEESYSRMCDMGNAFTKSPTCVETCKRYYKNKFIPIGETNDKSIIGNPIDLVFE